MRWNDCATLIEQHYEVEDQAARDSENLAMLVDRDDFALSFDYVNAVTDPNDPETKKERLERKRAGIKPPPLPILRAVAQRKPQLTELIADAYRQLREESMKPRLPEGKSKFELIEMNGWG